VYGVENSVDDGIENREKFGRKKNVRDRATPNAGNGRTDTTVENKESRQGGIREEKENKYKMREERKRRKTKLELCVWALRERGKNKKKNQRRYVCEVMDYEIWFT
jgi:hypothetical protein